MAASTLLYIGSAVIVLWGISHIAPTRSVANGFGPISIDNRRIITMTWASEGLTLCFIGGLVLLVTLLGEPQSSTAVLVYRAAAGMLVLTAAWTALTGARTSVIPMKVCPFIKTAVAVLYVLGSVL